MSQAQVNPVQQNIAAKQLLAQAGLPVTKRVGVFPLGALGSETQIRLLNVGITTGVTVRVKADINITAQTTVSEYGAFPLLQRVAFKDYNQIERVSCDAYSLNEIRNFKKKRRHSASFNTVDAAIYAHPTAVNNNTLVQFDVEIPLAYDAENWDLRGASLSQAVVGEQFIALKLADALVNADGFASPYVAGTATFNSVTVEVYQHYLQPPSIDAIPLLDLSMIYEIKGLFKSSSDVSANGQKLINYPNVRSVLSTLHVCVDNGDPMGPANFGSLAAQIMVNSTQPIMEKGYTQLRSGMRDAIQYDAPSGVIYMDHRAFPIQTVIYGNVQLALNWATIAGGVTYVQSAFESVYPSGTPLPGISTQG